MYHFMPEHSRVHEPFDAWPFFTEVVHKAYPSSRTLREERRQPLRRGVVNQSEMVRSYRTLSLMKVLFRVQG